MHLKSRLALITVACVLYLCVFARSVEGQITLDTLAIMWLGGGCFFLLVWLRLISFAKWLLGRS